MCIVYTWKCLSKPEYREIFELLATHVDSLSPIPLQLLARNVIRRAIGGVHFRSLASRLPITQKRLINYIIIADLL